MNSTKHTPTPWRVEPDQDSHGCNIDVIGGRFTVVMRSPEVPVYGHPRQTIDVVNAAFIVKACNAHDSLVAALRDVLDGWDNWADKGRAERAIDRARAALAKVQS